MDMASGAMAFPQLQQLLNSTCFDWSKSLNDGQGLAAPQMKPLGTKGKYGGCDKTDICRSAADEDFQSITYSSRMERMSLVAELQEVRAHIAELRDDGHCQAGVTAKQLEFSFFAESRTEELQIFNQRTGKVAEGLKGGTKETFTMTSQRVSVRFSMSLTMSGAALQGFAGASEALADGAGGTMDKFLALANDALNHAEEISNKVLSFVNDLMSGDGDVMKRLEEFLGEMASLGFMDGMEGFGAPAVPGAEGPAQAGQLNMQAFSMQLEFEFEYESISIAQHAVQESDPIVLDLDGDGIELTSYRDGARFDITGSGRQVSTAFVTGGDAFLAIDKNGNGKIDSGKELFGDQNGADNGFEELRKYDSNRDGLINAQDRDFAKLKLFMDNGNGKTEEGELISLQDAGIEEIQLGYRNVNEIVSGGNRIEQVASFKRNDGTHGTAADAILNYTV